MTRLDRLIEAERLLVPKSRYADKSKSLLMKLANFFVRTFNKNFMSGFITTIGPVSYYPPDMLTPTQMEDAAVAVECHEFVHKWDYEQHKWTYGIRYLLSKKFRRDAEIRGYTMDLLTHWLRYRVMLDPRAFLGYFTGPDYLYMDKDGTYSLEQLRSNQMAFVQDLEGFLARRENEPYRLVRAFFRTEGMLYEQCFKKETGAA